LENTAKRIRNAMEVRATSASAVNTTLTGGNSIDRNLNIVSGPYVDRRVGNSTTWFYGKPKEAFGYIQNWPLQTVMAPENSELDFTSDIVTRVKVTERGTPVVMEKRKMAKATA
jgi:anaerobic ribonucleoside-triphosphate reductase